MSYSGSEVKACFCALSLSLLCSFVACSSFIHVVCHVFAGLLSLTASIASNSHKLHQIVTSSQPVSSSSSHGGIKFKCLSSALNFPIQMYSNMQFIEQSLQALVTFVCLHLGHVFAFEAWACFIHIFQKECPQIVCCGSRSTCKQMGQLVGK